MEAYGRLTCAELRRDLASRDARTSGRKIELVQRLESYDRNDNFREPVIKIQDQDVVPDWPESGFKQLTESNINCIPPITTHHITGYLTLRMALDKMATNDSQAVLKGKLLLESERLEACSYADVGVDGAVFFSGLVGAAMKKLIYSSKLKLSAYGDVVNAHCECGSGTGPHGSCKHIAAFLFGLVDIREEGKLGATNTSCTDQLQTFHKPSKKFVGSPVKVQNLSKNPLRARDVDDVRPLALRQREGRFDHMRNAVVNFCGNTSVDIGARFLTEGTNLQEASRDHRYLKRPLTEQLVYNSVEVSPNKALCIEKQTKSQANCTLWFTEREWRLTASRFGEVCSLTARRNLKKLCQSLIDGNQIQTPATAHGLTYEKIAIKEFEKQRNVKVEPCGLFIDRELPFLAGTPDGVVGDTLIEVKCPFVGKDDFVKPGKKFPFLTKQDKEIVLKRSHRYFAQVQGQLHVAGKVLCHFVIYTHKDMLVLDVPYDREYCCSMLVPKLEAFYSTYLVPFIASTL